MKLTTLLSIRLPLCLALGLATASASRAAEEPLDLAVGDPARRDRHATVTLDAIVDTRTGDVLSPDELASRLGKIRLLLVGEGHTSIESHRVERRILEALVSAGREVRVGLEMYPYTEQAWLDRWSKGQLTEDGFLALSRWYRNWGYNWGYYRDIFLFARDRGLPLAGVNTPRDVVSAVRKKGFTNLTPEEAAHVPVRVDTDSAEHRKLFKAFFDADAGLHGGLTEEALDGMFRAQCTWDATMAFNAAKALEAGVRTGDLLLAFDGLPVPDKEALAILLAAKRWGDRVTLDVRRGGQPVTLTARLRRALPLPLATAAPLPF